MSPKPRTTKRGKRNVRTVTFYYEHGHKATFSGGEWGKILGAAMAHGRESGAGRILRYEG